MQTSTVYAATEHIRYGFGDSTLGGVLVARSGEGVCAILFGDDADALATELATLSACAPAARRRLDACQC